MEAREVSKVRNDEDTTAEQSHEPEIEEYWVWRQEPKLLELLHGILLGRLLLDLRFVEFTTLGSGRVTFHT